MPEDTFQDIRERLFEAAWDAPTYPPAPERTVARARRRAARTIGGAARSSIAWNSAYIPATAATSTITSVPMRIRLILGVPRRRAMSRLTEGLSHDGLDHAGRVPAAW